MVNQKEHLVNPNLPETSVGRTLLGWSEFDRARPVAEELWEVLDKVQIEKGYAPDRVRQRRVFDRISWQTLASDIAREHPGKGIGAGKQIRGKVFEALINADIEFGQRSPLELELLALAHNPDKFGLGEKLRLHRNPDMAFLITQDQDGVIISGVGESKLGLLNARAFSQLSATGFAKGVEALVKVVNDLDHPEDYGLHEIAKAKASLAPDKPLLRVADEFTQLVVVPANRNIQWKSSLINRREFSQQGRKDFYVLLSDTKHLETKKAAFSTAEVGAIAEAIVVFQT